MIVLISSNDDKNYLVHTAIWNKNDYETVID